MRHLLLATAALSLLAAPAFADPPQHKGKGHDQTHRAGPPGLASKPHAMPPGQAKKLYGKGEYLPRGYYSQQHYINDARYRSQLPPAPAGYRWVRYGDDAYLVQARDGLISRIVRSLFG